MATASILNAVVPGRRRERKRQKELEANLDSRWGDTSITGPVLGGWIQPTAAEAVKRPGVKVKAVPSADSTTRTLGQKRSQPTENLSKQNQDRFPLSIRILPELEKGDNFAEECLSPFTPQDEQSFNVYLDGEKSNGWLGCSTIPEIDEAESAERPSTTPPVVYKTATGQHLKELSNMADRPTRHASPSSDADTARSSTVTFKPASDDYAKELNSMGYGSSRSQTPNTTHGPNVPSASRFSPAPPDLFTLPDVVPRAASSQSSRTQVINPLSTTGSPRPEKATSTLSDTNLASLPPRPRTASDSPTHLLSRQRNPSTKSYRSNSPAPIRIIHKQTENPIDLRDLSQFGLIQESSSSLPTRNVNASPPPQPPHKRSASVPSSSPQSPPSLPSTFLASTTSNDESVSTASRTPASPPLDSPPVRPQSRRITLGSSTMSRRESFTSDPGSAVTSVTSTTNATSSVSPTSASHLSARLSSSSSPSSVSPAAGAGYYNSLAGEYKLIARDVEEKALSEQERKNRGMTRKDRERGVYYGPQTLVPKGTDLWG